MGKFVEIPLHQAVSQVYLVEETSAKIGIKSLEKRRCADHGGEPS